MIKKYPFEKFIDKKALFITRDSYIHVFEGDTKLYCLDYYLEEIQTILKKHSADSIESIISEIQKVISMGLVILETSKKITVIPPFLDSRLSWFENDKNIIFSDSSVEIAKLLNLQLSEQRISSQFIFGLPFYPFQTISMWEEISNIEPLNYLVIAKDGCFSYRIKFEVNDSIDADKLLINIKTAFLSNVGREVGKGEEISCDVSGGVDSAAIAFTLNKMIPEFSMLHSESNASSNSDTKWAKHIANNLGRNLEVFDSIESTEKRFAVSEGYINGIIPSSPLLWADSEGYLQSVINYIKTRKNPMHFLGIGGDELFTPMPSNPWSIVRQEGLMGFFYAVKYSLVMKRSFVKCLNDLFDNSEYRDTISENLEEVFECSPKTFKRELGWIDGLKIPGWISEKAKVESRVFLSSLLSTDSKPIVSEKTTFQILQSLMFQKSVLRQIQLTNLDIHWVTPFLDRSLIEVCLSIPAKNKINSKITKPMLQKALKGIVPIEVFRRGFKGDYSDALYKGYKKAIRSNFDQLEKFELVKMGIIDVDKLKIELSLPTGDPYKIDFFERLCSLERWIRQVKSYINNNLETN